LETQVASEDDDSHPLDVALGARVRARRKELGFSQHDLARACGITFQQIQKYEHGVNRISFSRLVQIAHALECSVVELIGSLDKAKPAKSFFAQQSHLALPGASELLTAYVSIKPSKSRRAVLNLARQLARDAAKAE
jgi:transcriptional regulator with XRE-family HTH domain